MFDEVILVKILNGDFPSNHGDFDGKLIILLVKIPCLMKSSQRCWRWIKISNPEDPLFSTLKAL